MEQENLNNTDSTVKEVRGVPFLKGDDPRRNSEGRPKGSEDFKTQWFKLVDKLAKNNNITAEEVEEQVLAKLYQGAKSGDYRFIKDVLDRRYGKAQDILDVTTGGEKMILVKFLDKENETNNS